MNSRTMTMQVSGNPHNPGDILHINNERWVVTQVDFNFTYSTIYLEPLSDAIARNKIISVPGYEGTIADYLKVLCDEYEYDCSC